VYGSRTQPLREAVQQAVASANSTGISKAVSASQEAFDKLVEEAKKAAASTQQSGDPRAPYKATAQTLIDKMKEWADRHADQKETVEREIAALESEVSSRAIRQLKQRIEMYERNFQGMVRNEGD